MIFHLLILMTQRRYQPVDHGFQVLAFPLFEIYCGISIYRNFELIMC